MKAICLHQPWASLVAVGAKRIETRSWPTSHRGDVAILATAWAPLCSLALARVAPYCDALRESGLNPEALPAGGVIGMVRVTECVRVELLRRDKRTTELLTERELAFGDFGAGRYGWLLRDARAVELIPCRGRQLIFALPSDVESQLRRALKVSA